MRPPKTIPIDRNLLIAAMNAVFGKVAYGPGAKAALDAKPGDFDKIDCSGFVRWLIHQASNGQVAMPDGSWHQQNWCTDQMFRAVRYEEAGKKDSVLRIAFINTAPGKVGHVWLIINGQTIESYGGHGPGRRRWNTPVLRRGVDACYELSARLP